VSKRLGGRLVVPPLDLELEAGTRLGVVGPNGAGTTTLLRLLLGEFEPDTGERAVGETVRFMGIDQLRGELDRELTVREAIAGRQAVVPVGDRTVRVESFLDRWGFPARTHDTKLARLSGGERARVLLATVLVVDPPVLLADEPAASLDIRHRLDVIRALTARRPDRLSVVVVHDLDLAFTFFERVVVIDRGKVVADGPARSLIDDRRIDEAFSVRFDRLKTPDGWLLRASTGP
jgi:iron complex transport system ATP-binding protein